MPVIIQIRLDDFMLYSFLIAIVQPFLNLINGKAKIYNKENIPDGNYIIVAPHRTWMDPVLIALAIYPQNLALWQRKSYLRTQLLPTS